MGFYDDDFDSKPKRRSSPGTWLASVIIAALVGSGATMAVMPTLLKNNIIGTQQQSSPTSGKSTVSQGVTYNVQSNVTEAVNRVKPAVVTVVNLQKANGFFGPSQEQEAGKGSGVLIDNQGHIVTNNHVVEGAADLEVVLNEEHVKAKLIGTDVMTDLAVIQIPKDKLKDIAPVELGSSDSLQIGEPAIAIGNPLGEFEQTVTVGVISAKKRTLPVRIGNQVAYEQTVLQTDAAINPGNSGGALINIKGQLIGINSAKIASTGVEGLGFAIPVDEVKPVVEQLIAKGKVVRPGLGITIAGDVKDIPENYRAGLPIDYGVAVKSVSPGGPADKAGLKSGDVIAKIDNNQVKTFLDLRRYLFTKKPGDSVEISYYRNNQESKVTVSLEEIKYQ